MKRYLLILLVSCCTVFSAFAQDDGQGDENGASKLQERMRVYIQKRLGLNKSEAERFSPVFLRYMLELRKTHREFKADRPMLQLRVAEIRVRFREEFKTIMDEKRANKIFECQREFEIKVLEEVKQRRLENRTGPRTRNVVGF